MEGTMLDERTTERAAELLGTLKEPVKLLVFSQEFECTYCGQNAELMEDVAGLSDLITLEKHDFEKSAELRSRLGVDKIPATVITADGRDLGIRFFGIPSGYEFVSLLESVRMVSTGEHELSDDTVSKIQALDKTAHIQVFVTPTCPHCPKSVVLAHRLAYISNRITGDMVEAIEFPHLAQQYDVSGVPRSVINGEHFIEGAVPEKLFVQRILEAAGAA
jgi:glutaredoxin-like protein